MHYYNAVLLPPESLARKITDFAQSVFADQADSYCLSNKVLPHITLCQYQCNGETPDFSEISSVLEVALAGYGARHGTKAHAGFMWPELTVYKTQSLVSLQGKVAAYLDNKGIKTTTDIGDYYWPHVTLCRIGETSYKSTSVLLLEDVSFGKNLPWTFAYGCSDENGQFLGVL